MLQVGCGTSQVDVDCGGVEGPLGVETVVGAQTLGLAEQLYSHLALGFPADHRQSDSLDSSLLTKLLTVISWSS